MGSAGTTTPTRNTAICCCRFTRRASTTPARCRSSISTSTAAASTWRRRCSRKCCRSICSRRGGCSAPRSASSASPSPGGSVAGSADRLPGLIALVLLAACPLYYGHMFMNAEGRAVRGGDGAVSARPRAPARPISKALPDHALHPRRLGFGLSIGSRIMAGFGVIEALGALALLFAIEARTDGVARGGRPHWPALTERLSRARSSPTR